MTHDIRALSREWFERVWNQRDESAITDLASPQLVCRGLGEEGQSVQGLDEFKQFRSAFVNAFPDLKVRVEDVLVDGDQSAIRLSFTGTLTGDGIGIAPNGRTFFSTAIVIVRWKNGQIVEAWNEFDGAGMMRQLQSTEAKLRV
jgi:predicted ester cyclase